MIVLDTSALVAIFLGEPEGDQFERSIAQSARTSMSAVSYVELFVVIEARLGEEGTRDLALYLHEASILIVPVDREQADLARFAYSRFGKGKHAASLNFGDCFSYALAKRLGQPLLYKGKDFTLTDLLPA